MSKFGRRCKGIHCGSTAQDGTTIFWRVVEAQDACFSSPLLVVVNGLANDQSQWAEYFRGWEGRFSYLYWDYRGHGLTPRPLNPERLTINSQSRDLQLVLQEAFRETRLDLERPVVLVAYSLGTQVALEWSARHCSGGGSSWQPRVAGIISILGTSGRVLDAFAGRHSHSSLQPPSLPFPLREEEGGGGPLRLP
uniref:AB hydrolase-1 domain-containing protein n=1 Tax=Tetraselmis sp. GSL018 TaxID=582737 RepID=A0A061SL71_9CHLO